MKIILGIVLVAAVSTIGDYVWYEVGVRHVMTAGVIHGAILLAAVGAVVGAAAGRVAAGIPVGAVAGVGGALVYYALLSVAGRWAVIEAWAACWLILAVLDARVLRAPARRSWGEALARGLAAAVLGGVAFYFMMDTLWGRAPAGGRNYVIQFGAWLVAWAPGILALTVSARRR
jgi:hypothetical protein